MIRTALIAAILSATIALPAHADTGFAAGSRTATRTATDGSTACLRDPGSARCSTYQAALIRTVEKTVDRRANVSTSDVGRRQLDALIASIN